MLFACSGVAAKAQRAVITAEIVEYGVYSAKVEQPASGSNASMKSALISNICHVATTLEIPARDDLQFGLRYVVHGPTPGAPIQIRKIVRFPDHMKPPPAYAFNETVQIVKIGRPQYTGWVNWHTRPGVWMFQFFHGEQKLTELVFSVVADDGQRFRDANDSDCFVMSGLLRTTAVHS
ncbi:MAG TPA: DUF3859 domain-containing protein [Reyranella sp.]|nr:DUF3859 domain-containing protein [Reyranella sp.]